MSTSTTVCLGRLGRAAGKSRRCVPSLAVVLALPGWNKHNGVGAPDGSKVWLVGSGISETDASKAMMFSAYLAAFARAYRGRNIINQRNIVSVSAIIALGLALSVNKAPAQLAKDVVGTWTIKSAGDAYSSTPKGSLILTENGRYSLQLLRPDLPKYASNNRTKGTPAEYKATVEGSLSYFGTYSVNGTDLTLHVEGSTFPNWIGTDQKRVNLSVIGDELKYTNTAPSGGGGAAPLVWRRVK